MKVAIVSADTMIYRKQKDDTCSPIVRRVLDQVSFKTELVQPVPNDREVIRKILAKIADAQMADLILTIGGIGCREEDCVPEATKAVVDKEIPGRFIFSGIKSQSQSRTILTTFYRQNSMI